MSALILRCCRRGVAKAQLLSQQPRALRSSGLPSCGTRQFSTSQILPKKPLDAIDKLLLGSVCLWGAAIVKEYYDLFQELSTEQALSPHPAQEAHKTAAAHNPAQDEQQEKTHEEPKDEKHEAEKAYEEHLKELQARYEHEIKEAQAKASEYEARANRLEKELENEMAKHAAELKSQADMIAAKLQEEIQSLKEEAAKARSGESNGREKLRLVNEITELKRQIESLGLTGSDLDKSYLLRKLAMVMGVFAFENAMMNGDPLEKEVVFLQGGDALIDAAISALPEEAKKGGSWTPLELQMKFVDSKPKLRELVLIPSTGGGAVSHLIARGASNLKVKEENAEEGGVESIFDQVENLIKEGKLVEAADVLEQGVQGTEAQDLAAEWAKQARLRASIEQVHDVLRAHAASISMSLA